VTLSGRSITREEVAVKLARWLSVARPLKRHGVTVRVADLVPPLVAEIVTVFVVVWVFVVTVKLAEVLPVATVTLLGTVATAVELLERVTTVPAEGAGPVRVTVPVEEVPPVTELGLRAMELKVPAVTVKLAVLVTP
jgi:hypothetical protein